MTIIYINYFINLDIHGIADWTPPDKSSLTDPTALVSLPLDRIPVLQNQAGWFSCWLSIACAGLWDYGCLGGWQKQAGGWVVPQKAVEWVRKQLGGFWAGQLADMRTDGYTSGWILLLVGGKTRSQHEGCERVGWRICWRKGERTSRLVGG